ncbi:MAG: response regulator transcription factor [Stellaceae bacterium]
MACSIEVQAGSVTIFIVDDDEAVRDSLKLLLESYGLTVEDYGTTAEFTRHYRPRERQCLILDQHLPGATGLDFLASAEGAALSLPVVLVTGRGDKSLRARAAELGVCVYLEKPVVDDMLMAAIRTAVEDVDG